MNWIVSCVLLTVTNGLWLAFMLWREKAAMEERSKLIAWASSNSPLVFPSTASPAPPPEPERKVVKEVRRIQFPVPLGGVPIQAARVAPAHPMQQKDK